MKNKIGLMCEECLTINYTTNKSVNVRLVTKKFCKKCNKHTVHKEAK